MAERLRFSGTGAENRRGGIEPAMRRTASRGRCDLRRKGIAYIWTAVAALTIIGMAGLATDVGYVVYTNQQLQNAADAASLAGAQVVRESAAEARAQAKKLGEANTAAGVPVQLADNLENLPDGDIVVGFYKETTKVFFPRETSINAVRVVARRTAGSQGGPLPLLFGPVFGVQTINVQRSAIAIVRGGTGAGLIVLNETEDSTFRLAGNVYLDVNHLGEDGSVQVNSESEDALKFDGTAAILDAGEINVCAEDADTPPPAVYDGDVNTNQEPISDPLAGLTPPPLGPDQSIVFSGKVTGGDLTLSPGYYPEGIYMTGGIVTLESGIYVLGGEGLKVTGGDLYAHEVMFYLLAGDSKCVVKLTGNGIIEITAISMEDDPTYGGIAIWQDEDNDNEAQIAGTDSFSGIDGTLYFPENHLDLVGTSDTFDIRQLICDTLRVSGSGNMTINYDGRYPAPGTKPFLVQ